MILFKKDKYFMIDEKLLNKDESIEFIHCLEVELFRHIISQNNCLSNIQSLKCSFLFLTFWFSSYKRHIQDVEMIEKSIRYLKAKWNIK